MPVILAICEVEIGRIMVLGQPWQIVQESPFQTIKAVSVVLSFQLCRKCSINRRMRSKPTWAYMRDPIWKIAKAKRGWGMTQVVECLPSKHKALSSSSSTYKKVNKRGTCRYILIHMKHTEVVTDPFVFSFSSSSPPPPTQSRGWNPGPAC
jgi:hypothetical protein